MNRVALRQLKASAGSGKTYALTGDFLRLLAGAADEPRSGCRVARPGAHAWPEILAVTFTNRAATEMRERVLSRLKDMALGVIPPEKGWDAAGADRAVDGLLRGLTERRADPDDERGNDDGLAPAADLLPAVSYRSRVGKGSCQGTFCGARITAHLYDCALAAGTGGTAGLKRFLRERWRGQRPVLWGDQMAQAELKEALYLGLMGLDGVDADVPEDGER